MIIIFVVIKIKCVFFFGIFVDIFVVFYEGLTFVMKGTWRMCIFGFGNEGTVLFFGFFFGFLEYFGRSVIDFKVFV